VTAAVEDAARRATLLEAELIEVCAKLRSAQAELHALRASLAFRAAYAAAGLLHAMAPPGTRRGRLSAYARTLICWLFRWRCSVASRPARKELQAALLGLRARKTDAPGLRHVAAERTAPVFAIEDWEETPLLHRSEVDELVAALWASLEPADAARRT
jgi:hypothetical protein